MHACCNRVQKFWMTEWHIHINSLRKTWKACIYIYTYKCLYVCVRLLFVVYYIWILPPEHMKADTYNDDTNDSNCKIWWHLKFGPSHTTLYIYIILYSIYYIHLIFSSLFPSLSRPLSFTRQRHNIANSLRFVLKITRVCLLSCFCKGERGTKIRLWYLYYKRITRFALSLSLFEWKSKSLNWRVHSGTVLREIHNDNL